jgi:3-hydroxybutyryl-CoA dehydrogenase
VKTIENVGVVGAGVMGAGVAENLAHAGHSVILVDVRDSALERARATIRDALRLQRMMTGAKAGPAPSEVLGRITFTTDYSRLERADYLVENVPEIWSVKKEVYGRLDAIVRPEVVFAADTSCIPITRIAGATGRPDRVIGIHFMNPVPMKATVEVVRGWHTSDETLETTRALLAAMGKGMVVVRDGPGFVSNRVLMLTVNEAIFTVQDGTAEAADVDRIFRECFGHKMGPLETADLIGLDTILNSLEVLCDEFRDGKFRPSPLLQRMVAAGLLGRKSGEGFYRY